MSGEAEGEQGASGEPGKLLAVIADEDTVTGLLLAGVGHAPAHTPRGSENFFVVRDDTSDRACAEAFAKLAAREDVAVILVVQSVADGIRDVIDAHDAPVPAVLEIPAADGRYDVHRDGILRHAGLVAVSEYVPD